MRAARRLIPARLDYQSSQLSFSGEQALAIETEFVESFPNRDSGQPNNLLAAQWLNEQFSRNGLRCQFDYWEIINFSQPVALNNLVCQLPGQSAREIVVMAHHDQSPNTISGADNDGSGIAIMLHLAEILAAEGTPRYTMTFLSTDAEEFGMIGSDRFVSTHPDPTNIIAAISLDNLGKALYEGVDMSAIGQFRGVAPLWLLLTARDSAVAAGNLWVPQVRSPVDQILGQAVPISFMDQGPLNAAGVPAVGFAGMVPAGEVELHWQTYHSPDDTLAYQSSETLEQTGRASEALLRQLLSQEQFAEESGPYLYLEENDQVLRGWALWLIFIAVVGIFAVASISAGNGHLLAMVQGWRRAVPHFLGLWLPWLGSVFFLYLFVAIGLMDEFHIYPALPKDPVISNPRWPAVILYVIGLLVLIFGSRALMKQLNLAVPSSRERLSLAYFVIFLGGIYLLFRNPFSVLLLLPLCAWLFIDGRQGKGRAVDLLFFILGGSFIYALIYFFGFVILRNNLAVLWYLLMMFSIQEVSFATTALITALLGAGLLLVIPPAAASQPTAGRS